MMGPFLGLHQGLDGQSLGVSSPELEILQAAIRRWEDGRRRVCGPSSMVSMADWPTCFAVHGPSDDVFAGTMGGMLAVLRPGGRDWC